MTLIGDIVETEIEDFHDECLEDDSIHVISINHKPLRDYEGYFSRLRAAASNITLFHTGDEWLSGGYSQYRHFDRVIRNYETTLAACEGILTLPLGYPNTASHPDVVTPASQRALGWSFAGQIKASRKTMVRAMASVDGFDLVDTSRPDSAKLDARGYNGLMARTIFSPCPMGNVNLETWRLYESLEHGAIPLLEQRIALDYHRRLFGAHPLPVFPSWRQAARWCCALRRDPIALDAVQGGIRRWWRAKKQEIAGGVRDFLRAPSRAAALERFARRPLQHWPALYHPVRFGELLRHQDASSLLWRTGKALPRPAWLVGPPQPGGAMRLTAR